MKKLILSAIAALSMMAVASDAGFYVTWRSGTGAAFGIPASFTGGDTIGVVDPYLVQFIVSPAGGDGVQDLVLSDGVGGLVFDGDDIVLDEIIVPGGGSGSQQIGQWGNVNFGDVSADNTTPLTPFADGNFFVRLYATSAPVRDQLYLNSAFAPLGIITDVPPATPSLGPRQEFTPWTGYQSLGTDGLAVGLIPEPMSVAMLLLGAMTIFVRHRRR